MDIGDDWDSPEVEADILIVAGDFRTGGTHAESDLAIGRLQRIGQRSKAKRRFVVPGNHEGYDKDISTFSAELEKDLGAEGDPSGWDVFTSPGKALVVDGVRFLGTTLWFDTKAFQGTRKALRSFADFRFILEDGSRVSPERMQLEHEKSRTWLATMLSHPFDGKTVVITHHAPSERSSKAEFVGHPFNACFYNAMDEFVEKSGAVLWHHGHMHHTAMYRIGNTTVLCNPRGYTEERGNNGFIPDLVWEI